ncbi:hypothetical protein P9J83_17320 [Clostridium sporogenes]|uniref:Uncharacterized protein n=1 Tax=Clostridium sporogenes TaxID=1509 RepID=A0AAE4JXP5_CLOSG|nr:hypothetical protein [Clostridium sporogenes]MDS1005227.1 hypothetical protein [Clostridium sporogenes]
MTNIIKPIKTIKANQCLSTIVNLSVMCAVTTLTGSMLIGAVMGASASQVLSILNAVYRAYKTGASISNAVAAVCGPGAAAMFLVNILISYGISYALNSPGLQSY